MPRRARYPAPGQPGARSAYDSLAHAALARAHAGRSVVLPAFRHLGHEARAAAAPVRSEPGTVLVPREGVRIVLEPGGPGV